MEGYRSVLPHLGDKEALRQHLHEMEFDDLVTMVEYLADRQRTREDSVRCYKDKKKAEYGCSVQWQRVKNNPEAYKKQLAYVRGWKAQRRAEKKPTHETSR